MADLVTMQEALTYLGWAQDQDGFLAQTIPTVSAQIEKHCPAVRFQTPLEATELYDGGAENLVTRRAPVTAVAEVKDTDDGSILSPTDDYDFDPEAGLVYLRVGSQAAVIDSMDSRDLRWGTGRRRWSVKYSAGMAAVPAEVKQSTLEVIAMLAARRDQSASQVSLGDLSTGHARGGMPMAGDSGPPLITESRLSTYHARSLIV